MTRATLARIKKLDTPSHIKQLLVALCALSDDDGPVSAWVDELADLMGVCSRRVRQVQAEAIAAGVLAIARQGRKKNIYTLFPEAVTEEQPDYPAETAIEQAFEEEEPLSMQPVSDEADFTEACFSEVGFRPLVVVSEKENLDKSLIPRTTTRGVKPASLKPVSGIDHTERDKLLSWLADARLDAPVDVAARHVQEAAAKIVRRPDWEDEIDAMLDHAEKSGLGAGWVVNQLRKYAAVSPNTRLGFTWVSGTPKGEYHAAS